MKVLVLKKTKSHRIDRMEYAIQRAFSQENDIVTFATIKVGSLLKNVTKIKELIKQYQPDVVIAKGLLASILFFELPKSIKKIIINPLMLHAGSNDSIRLKFAFEYGDVRLVNWLEKKTEEFLQSEDKKQLQNTYCIVRDFMDNFSQYDKWVSCYNQASTEDRTKNIFLTNTKDVEESELLGHYHRIINKARKYFDPEFELVNINEVL